VTAITPYSIGPNLEWFFVVCCPNWSPGRCSQALLHVELTAPGIGQYRDVEELSTV
jgi:hypothetical protein